MPYLQNATHEGFIFNEATKAEFAGNGTHAAMAMRYFVANLPTGQLDGNNQPIYANYNIGQAVGLYSSNGTGANLTEIYLDPVKLAITATETELSNVTVWSANSILTQGRANTLYQANGSYLNDVLTNVNMSYGVDAFSGMRKPTGGGNFVAGRVTLGTTGLVGVISSSEASAIEFSLGDIFATLRIRQYAHTLIIQNSGFEVETGTANWTWSANSILTQGRGDSRYQPIGSYLTTANAASTYLPSANFTYANISGTIPTATNTTLGAVKVGSNLTIANGVLSATSSGGFQNGDTLNGGTY